LYRSAVVPSTWRRLVQTLSPLLLASAWGCAVPGARFVLQTDRGGVVAIPNDSDVWPTNYRRKALELIAGECPDGYEITDERDVAVERQERLGANDNPRWDFFGGLVPVPDETEHQIYYRCKPSASGPPSAAAGAEASGADRPPAAKGGEGG
jgi:hypothetical protein